MRKFDGKDLVNWILQMEKYFDLHGVPLLQNVYVASSYLEQDQFLWYKGLCSHKPLVMWSIFTEEIIAHYDDTKRNTTTIRRKNRKMALLQSGKKNYGNNEVYL